MQLFLLYPWAFSKFAFNHRILVMIFLTGNFFNPVDRDGLHGSLLDPRLLCASDKTRLGLSCSECLERYSHLIIPLVVWMVLWQQKFMARYWSAKVLPDFIAPWEHLVWCVFFLLHDIKIICQRKIIVLNVWQIGNVIMQEAGTYIKNIHGILK